MVDFFNSKKEQQENIQEEDNIFNNFNIIRLFGKERLEDIQEKISKATGLAFVTVDYKGEPVTQLTSFTPFCQKIRQRKEAENICMASDAFGGIQAAATQKPYVYFCPCGLLEIAIPIVIRGHYLGGFIGGQIRCLDAPKDICRLENVMQHTEDFKQNKEMKKLYNDILSMEYDKFVSIAELISLIINQLGEKEVSRLMQKDSLNEELKKVNEDKKKLEVENRLKNAELITLRSQMNPYFLFRSLNSISNLAVVEDAYKTNEMITMFAEFLRWNFVNAKKTISILEEVENVERYLKIQKVRLGDKLKYSIDMPDYIKLQKIPSLTIMPFVEKAIFHGIVQKKEKGMVQVVIDYEKDDVVVSVEDDGLGLSDNMLSEIFKPYKNGYEGDSIEASISNTRKRLITLFGSEYDAAIYCSEGKGTKSIIRYPKNFNKRID
ncbi:histidine kinase/DNA gyrase B/HSP90-like ATPase [Natranaerovirga hydrolytica]|uniref:Histidine kinase/DNA gyrase B/HSP90-like ATPase n=1 Tax=Natranaerovirga hydrolytica TaxID=680378 RepID=A0A4R1M7W5_9FIRM|nr:PocR ligand-binding domain-containing protein [Natranaerovirga hydrolytica]TCK88025.1 histidine kinase/DNA gyrase B/HSP90-like ATPase [Natranaerovirga hydrolytica]